MHRISCRSFWRATTSRVHRSRSTAVGRSASYLIVTRRGVWRLRHAGFRRRGGLSPAYVFPNSLWGRLQALRIRASPTPTCTRITGILNLGVFGLGTTNGIVDTLGFHSLGSSTSQMPSDASVPDGGGPVHTSQTLSQFVITSPFTDGATRASTSSASGKNDMIALGTGNDVVTENAGNNIIYVKTPPPRATSRSVSEPATINVVVGNGTNVITGGPGKQHLHPSWRPQYRDRRHRLGEIHHRWRHDGDYRFHDHRSHQDRHGECSNPQPEVGQLQTDRDFSTRTAAARPERRLCSTMSRAYCPSRSRGTSTLV